MFHLIMLNVNRAMAQIQTGCNCIDQKIGGGLKPDSITLVYGEPETGKSTFALQCAVNCAVQTGGKILYIDCDNTFSTERLAQVAGWNFETVAERIVLFKPKDFREQTALLDHVENYLNGVSLIVIDTVTSLYSARAAESPKSFSANRELNRQLALLAEQVKVKKIPLLFTSQVRSIISDQTSGVRPVATRVLQFWADNIIFFKPTELPQTIRVIVEKPASTSSATQAACYIHIGEAGLRDTQLL
jgi:RecA/RadA recombinase